MGYPEAIRAAQTLVGDPSSMLCAAVNEWESPRTREWFVLADLFDLMHTVNSKTRPKSYPRPFRDPNSKQRGRTDKTRAEVVAILNAHGHNIEQEVAEHG